MAKCEVCGRILRSKESIKRGMGPSCAKKEERKYKETTLDTQELLNTEEYENYEDYKHKDE